MNHKIDGLNVTTEFRDYGEFIETAKSGPSDLPESQRTSRETTRAEFFGTRSFSQAVKLAEKGYVDQCEAARRMAAPLIDAISCRIEREEFVHDVEGTAIDVARYIDEEPECFIRPETVISDHGTGRKLIRLVVNVFSRWNVTQETILQKGSLAVALAELLEMAGHRVEITAALGMNNVRKDSILCMKIPVKAFDAPLNLPRLMFAVAHPSMFRRMMFSVTEQYPDKIRNSYEFFIGGGYGKVAEVPESMRGDIYLGSTGVIGADNPEQWLTKELEKQGVVLKARAAK